MKYGCHVHVSEGRVEWVGTGRYLRPSQTSAITIRPSGAVLGCYRAHATEGSNGAKGAFILCMLPSSAAVSSASARPRLTAALGTEMTMRTAFAVMGV